MIDHVKVKNTELKHHPYILCIIIYTLQVPVLLKPWVGFASHESQRLLEHNMHFATVLWKEGWISLALNHIKASSSWASVQKLQCDMAGAGAG